MACLPAVVLLVPAAFLLPVVVLPVWATVWAVLVLVGVVVLSAALLMVGAVALRVWVALVLVCVVSPMVSAGTQQASVALLLVWAVELELLPSALARVSLVLIETRTRSRKEQWRLSVSLSSPPLLG